MPIEDEDKAIAEVVDRVTEKFPDVEPAVVRETVDAKLDGFDGAVVRDFVPVLVEHEAADELRGVEADDA
ncbi:three-helix bundle dimerization domain-containing protein [Cellulomonas sp. PhB150]|uniref:three-helix bundle dimerization domain-containing protein n=1 Tax=Cellulomonas sp. PhB150 TaxID=2485188 RepID=UPI000F4ABF3D|nr:hypothetical protein [Cellulomonas sp. PhB150]ROS30989.1 hypothetical protein EDF34_0639 [Cellulomonas sp. PhB150]